MKVLAEGVKFAYSKESKVLDRVTWAVHSGVTGLIGKKGAGKTTLLSVIATMNRPQRGRLLVGGHDVTRASGRRAARRVIGVVPQRCTFAGELTVIDTVAYCAWVSGTDRGACGGAAENALRRVGLAGQDRRWIRELAADDRRLVAIAAAIAHDPEILVMDAPAEGLDGEQRARLRAIVAGLARGRAVLLSASDGADIAGMCDEVAVLSGGRVTSRPTLADSAPRPGDPRLHDAPRVDTPVPRVENGAVRPDIRHSPGGP